MRVFQKIKFVEMVDLNGVYFNDASGNKISGLYSGNVKARPIKWHYVYRLFGFDIWKTKSYRL